MKAESIENDFFCNVFRKIEVLSSPDGSKYAFLASIQPKRYDVQREGRREF